LTNVSIIGTEPFGLFVNINNTVYVNSRYNGTINVWFEGDVNPQRTISTGFSFSLSLFVSDNGDIYVDNGNNHLIDKWTVNTNDSVIGIYIDGECTGLFIDTNNTLYCSIWNQYIVVMTSLNSITNTTRIAAGTGSSGSTSYMLDQPHGIFIDINFDLYVADCNNNRIQRFQSGKLNGPTTAGIGSIGTPTLNCPTGIVLDADGYQFIVDRGSSCIFGSNSNGFQCLLGCAGSGPASNQLNNPETLSFDSYGNIFVTDKYNNRIQKFVLAANFCGEYYDVKLQSVQRMIQIK
jgi:tripartite motif-containing protein 71